MPTDPLTRHLPPEIVLYIFSWVCQPCGYHRDVVGYVSPLHLGSICSTWRKLAWSEPALWSYIYIKASPTRREAQAELLKEWISRTRSLPLDIVIRVADEGQSNAVMPEITYPYLNPSADDLLPLLVAECTRWRSIEVDITSPQAMHDLHRIYRDSLGLPLLQKVRIRTLWITTLHVRFYKEASNQTHLSVHPSHYKTCFQSPRKERLPNITSIVVENMKGSCVTHMLFDCHQTVRHIHVESIDTWARGDEDFGDPFPTKLQNDYPFLETFSVGVSSNLQMRMLCGMVRSAPKLRKMALTISRSRAIHALSDAKNFVQTRDIFLRTLVLRFPFFVDMDGKTRGESDIQERGMLEEEACAVSVDLIQVQSGTLNELEIEIPNFSDGVTHFVEALHRRLFANKTTSQDLSFPSLGSYTFWPYKFLSSDRIEPPRGREIYLESLRTIQTWLLDRLLPVMDADDLQARGALFTIHLPLAEENLVLALLAKEISLGLDVRFLAPHSGPGQPTVDWHLD